MGLWGSRPDDNSKPKFLREAEKLTAKLSNAGWKILHPSATRKELVVALRGPVLDHVILTDVFETFDPATWLVAGVAPAKFNLERMGSHLRMKIGTDTSIGKVGRKAEFSLDPAGSCSVEFQLPIEFSTAETTLERRFGIRVEAVDLNGTPLWASLEFHSSPGEMVHFDINTSGGGGMILPPINFQHSTAFQRFTIVADRNVIRFLLGSVLLGELPNPNSAPIVETQNLAIQIEGFGTPYDVNFGNAVAVTVPTRR